MPTAPLDTGIDLYYRDVGTGPPLVCVHGGFMSHRAWDPLLASLPESHRVIAIDLRGHGRSEASYGSCTDDQLAADLEALLRYLGLTDVTYLGWSLGATTGATYLGQYDDDRIQRVIFTSTGIFEGLANEAKRRDSDQEVGDENFLDFDALKQRHRRNNPTAMWEFVDGLFSADVDARTREWLYGIANRTPLDVVLDVLELYATMDYGRLYEYATAIDRPVLAIQGSEDGTATYEDVRYTVAEVFPAARFEPFDECGHAPFVEDSAHFLELISDFTGEA